MYSLIQTCTTPKANQSILSEIVTDSLADENNEYHVGNGKVIFYTASIDHSSIEVKIDGEQIGVLHTACKEADATFNNYATVSRTLRAGAHWVSATDIYGRSCSYSFRSIEGQSTVFEIKLETPKLSRLDPKILGILNGEWYGKGYQYNTKKTLDVICSFNDSTKKINISYPSLGCVGIWNIDHVSDETIYFSEHILYDKDKCLDLSDVELKIIGAQEVQLKYYYAPEHVLTAKVILRKL
jgi:hypothetical protein